jgi:hypothetical protein
MTQLAITFLLGPTELCCSNKRSNCKIIIIITKLVSFSIPFDLQNLQHHHQLHPHYPDLLTLAPVP